MDKIRILVVDDESRMRKLVRDFLVREGYEVLEAGDGEEALDLFYREKDIDSGMIPSSFSFASIASCLWSSRSSHASYLLIS